MSASSRSILSRLGRTLVAVLWLVAMVMMAAPASAAAPITPEMHMSGMDDCHHSTPLPARHAPAACAGLMACCAALPAIDVPPLRLPMALAAAPIPAVPLGAGRVISPLFEPPRALV